MTSARMNVVASRAIPAAVRIVKTMSAMNMRPDHGPGKQRYLEPAIKAASTAFVLSLVPS